MPRIKRWSPISHDFNRDAQIIAIRKDFGDWTALAWQEVLHEADRNDGRVGGTLDEIALRLAPISLQQYLGRAAKPARMMLERAADNGWIEVRSNHIQIVKYWKYHRRPEPEPSAPNPNQSDPKEESEKEIPIEVTGKEAPKPKPDPEPASPEPQTVGPSPKALDPKIKAVADRIYALDTVKFKPLIRWIKQAESEHFSSESIVICLERFEPYAAKIDPAWWRYLDSIMAKVTKDLNVASFDRAHEQRKSEPVNGPILSLVRSLADAKKI